MQILNDLKNVDQELVLTIGTFDGVHRGHRSLLQQLVQRARETARLSAVLTFHPHPRAVLHPEMRPVYLSTPQERSAIIASLGVDLMVVLPFTKALARTPGNVFIRSLFDQLCMRELWVGPGFALGKGRSGDVESLRRLAGELGYLLRLIDPVYDDGQVISSTRIRQLLRAGDVAEAGRLLGRLYAISSTVREGAQRGRSLGFRTANLQLDPDRALPGDGVYAVWAWVEGQRYRAVANVGVRPTFNSGDRLVEVHLLDFHDDLYGKGLVVEFAHRLRPEMRFADAAALVAQIGQDVERTRELLDRTQDGRSDDHRT
jgi:riboflavin kinase/FMN adenylyltransferase